MKLLAMNCLVIFLPACAAAVAAEDDYEINGVRIEKDLITVEHKSEVKSEKAPGTPAFQVDDITAGTDRATMMVSYNRYRNAPENYGGSEAHASLTSSSMGVGIGPSPPWKAWYPMDTVRILVNGQDVFARMEASNIEWRQGTDFARIRLVWTAPEAGIGLHVAVPHDREAAYVRFEVDPNEKIESLEVVLRCFPGAYASGTWGRYSHRWVSTPSDSVEVRKGEESLDLAITPSDPWVFFADRYHDYGRAEGFGPAALVLDLEEKTAGAVEVTDYGVTTRITYPPDSRALSFAIYSFTYVANSYALSSVKRGIEFEVRKLQTIQFWPEK